MIQRTIGACLLVIGAGLLGHALGVQIPSEWTVEAITNQRLALPALDEFAKEISLVLGGILSFLALVQLLHPNPVA